MAGLLLDDSIDSRRQHEHEQYARKYEAGYCEGCNETVDTRGVWLAPFRDGAIGDQNDDDTKSS